MPRFDRYCPTREIDPICIRSLLKTLDHIRPLNRLKEEGRLPQRVSLDDYRNLEGSLSKVMFFLDQNGAHSVPPASSLYDPDHHFIGMRCGSQTELEFQLGKERLVSIKTNRPQDSSPRQFIIEDKHFSKKDPFSGTTEQSRIDGPGILRPDSISLMLRKPLIESTGLLSHFFLPEGIPIIALPLFSAALHLQYFDPDLAASLELKINAMGQSITSYFEEAVANYGLKDFPSDVRFLEKDTVAPLPKRALLSVVGETNDENNRTSNNVTTINPPYFSMELIDPKCGGHEDKFKQKALIGMNCDQGWIQLYLNIPTFIDGAHLERFSRGEILQFLCQTASSYFS